MLFKMILNLFGSGTSTGSKNTLLNPNKIRCSQSNKRERDEKRDEERDEYLRRVVNTYNKNQKKTSNKNLLSPGNSNWMRRLKNKSDEESNKTDEESEEFHVDDNLRIPPDKNFDT